MSDLISREETVKALREYAEQKHANGENYLAQGILKAVSFIRKEENIPTAYDVDAVVEKIWNISEPIRPVGWSRKIEAVETKAVLDIVRSGGKE